MNELTDEMRQAIKAQLVASPKQKVRPNRHRLTGPGLWNRSFHSAALGVNPEQIEEATAYLRSHGITAEYDPKTGDLIATSEKQFQDVARVSGLRTGRDGYDVKDNDGRPISTGRQQAQGRERLKEMVRRMCEDPRFE